MSENALSTVVPSQPLSYTCKEAIPDLESVAGNILEDSLCYLMEKVWELGVEHCKGYCAKCRLNEFKGYAPNDDWKYRHLKKVVHKAFRNLPIPVYKNIAAPANGKCPACLISEALEKLPTITRYSSSRPMGNETFPCYLEPWSDGDAIVGSAALMEFRIDAAEIRRMPPEEKKKIREIVLPAQVIIKRIKALDKGEKERLSDDDLWILLDCDNAIKSLPRSPSFEWTQWAKNGIINNGCADHSAHISAVLFIAFSCYSEIRRNGVLEISYDDLCQLYIASYYASSGVAINDRQFENIFREALGGFIVNTSEDFGKRYYALTTLGKTVARKHIGAPPPFFSDSTNVVYPQTNSIEEREVVPVAVTQATANNDFDFTADMSQNSQANQSVVMERADKTEVKASVENNMFKQDNNQTVNLPPSDTAEAVKHAVEGVRAAHQDAYQGLQGVLQTIIPTLKHDIGKPNDDGSGKPSDSVSGGDSGKTNDKPQPPHAPLIEGAITVVAKGDIEDGDTIFQSAKIALAGARTQVHDIVFPAGNKHAEAAKRLLIHLAATDGSFTKEDVDGFCIDVGLDPSNNANVRQFLEKTICSAVGLPASGENKAKVFSHDFTTKKYSSAISVTVVSAE